MMWSLLMAGAVTVATPAAVPTPPVVEVMVVGTYHFNNPGLDRVNVRADDVTSPRRQRELAILADALLAFRPTRVMVEEQRPGPDHDVQDYARFSPAMLRTAHDEGIQIGYRVAALAHLPTVQGIDEQPGKGEPDYFPIDRLETYAKAHGQQTMVDAAFVSVRAEGARFEADQAKASVPDLLLRDNDPASATGGQDLYYRLLPVGNGDNQPGAELNAMWYLRNAKIFAKLMAVAKPGDHVLVVYGAGHGYWLRHFAANTPGYRLVDAMPYLRRAAVRADRN